MIRSPIHFGSVIVVLVCIDNAVAQIAATYRIQTLWFHAVTGVLLGLVWVFLSALARGADDASRTWAALSQVVRSRVWIGAGASAAFVVGINAVIQWALASRFLRETVQRPGDVLMCLALDAVVISIYFDAFYFPLLAFVPGMSPGEARSVSKWGVAKNGWVLITLAMALVMIPAISIAQAVPLYGLVNAAAVVFLGVFNYVAYRDVFERREDNQPRASGVLLPTPADR